MAFVRVILQRKNKAKTLRTGKVHFVTRYDNEEYPHKRTGSPCNKLYRYVHYSNGYSDSEEEQYFILGCTCKSKITKEDKIKSELKRLREFAEYALNCYSWNREPDGGDLQDKAEALGLEDKIKSELKRLIELRPFSRIGLYALSSRIGISSTLRVINKGMNEKEAGTFGVKGAGPFLIWIKQGNN